MAPRVTVPVTAIVTGYRRVDDLLKTLRVLKACEPAPAEILVHIDGGERDTAAAVQREFPDLSVSISDGNVGPGGGRNRLVAAATNPLVASFDDDSYPIDRDYFDRIQQMFAEYPDAWVVDANLFHRHEAIEPVTSAVAWVADFSGLVRLSAQPLSRDRRLCAAADRLWHGGS